MRGRKPKAPHLKVIAGTQRPDRVKPGVELPLVEGPPPAPDWLPNVAAREEFNRLAGLLHANKLLTEASLGPLAMLAALFGRLVQMFEAGAMPSGHLLAQFRGLSSDFGLTPVSQARLRPTPGTTPGNRFDRNGRR